MRPFPYPYRAMLAICSDLDETPDAETYLELMRFLNTREMTSMGEGVCLEVGNTIYFDMPPDQFAYWNTDDAGRAMVRSLIRSGHVDCLHSYGDLAITRAHAGRALDELAKHDLSLKVWIDHAVAPTNFGADIMRGHGDEMGHPAYHADLTLASGVRHVWRGRVTSVVGQDQPLNFFPFGSCCHPHASAKTLVKEIAKQILGRAGSTKYSFHARNRTSAAATLRDGSSVSEFFRCNPHPRGLEVGDTGDGIAEVISCRFLDRLVERAGCSILYTHLGKLRDRQFCHDSICSFRLLAEYQQAGNILVTTTRRVLDYQQARQKITAHPSVSGGITTLNIQASADAQLDGMTFYVAEPERVNVRVNGLEVTAISNPPDETERRSVSIPWSRLVFPECEIAKCAACV